MYCDIEKRRWIVVKEIVALKEIYRNRVLSLSVTSESLQNLVKSLTDKYEISVADAFGIVQGTYNFEEIINVIEKAIK